MLAGPEVHDTSMGASVVRIESGDKHIARLPGPAPREEDSDPVGFGKMIAIVLRVIRVIFERPDALPGLQAVEHDGEVLFLGAHRRHDEAFTIGRQDGALDVTPFRAVDMNPFRYTKRADAPARVAGDGERQGFGQPPAQQLDDRRGPAVQQQATAPKPALRAEAKKLALATQAKIDARTAEARRVPTAEELEATWAELMPRVLEKVKERYKAEYAQKVVDPLQAAWEKASVDDKPRLLREAKKEHFQEEESFVPLISECAAAILAGNRDFQKIYHAVYDVIRSGEADGMEAAQAAIAALGQAVRGDPKRLQQRDEAAEPATLLADAAGARPAYTDWDSSVWTLTYHRTSGGVAWRPHTAPRTCVSSLVPFVRSRTRRIPPTRSQSLN